VQALYDSANNLALYLDRTLAVSLALLLFAQGRQERLWWALLVAPQGIAWLLTFSKGSLFLAAPAMLLVLGGGGFWLLRRQGRRVTPLVALGALLVLGALVLMPFIGAERFQRLLDFEQGTGFLRVQLWRSAWQMALDHPLLGVGPDQFLYHYRSGYLLPEAWQEPNLNHPHNLLLDWWTRLGAPGLVLGIGWLTAGVASIVRWLRAHSMRSQHAALALGCLAAAAAGLAHGLIDVSYALPELMLVWVLLFHLAPHQPSNPRRSVTHATD
jgi:O-antigen ligase